MVIFLFHTTSIRVERSCLIKLYILLFVFFFHEEIIFNFVHFCRENSSFTYNDIALLKLRFVITSIDMDK